MKVEELLNILENLLKIDDILATMVVTKGLEGIYPKGIKIKNVDLWRVVNETTGEIFELISHFYKYSLQRVYLELGSYTIIVVPLSESSGLVIIINSLANFGLLDVEVENTKRKLLGLREKR